LDGHGCPFCAGNKKLTLEEFVQKAKEIHKDKYDYSLVKYKNSATKVKIKCLKCGNIFEQTPNKHLLGRGCPYCAVKQIADKNRLTKEEFIKKAVKKHGKGKYDYSLVNYINCETKVEIRCLRCGKIFKQTPRSHLQGRG